MCSMRHPDPTMIQNTAVRYLPITASSPLPMARLASKGDSMIFVVVLEGRER
jgi:hypothetical protein